MLVIAVQEAGAGKKKKEEGGANVAKQEVHIFRDHSE